MVKKKLLARSEWLELENTRLRIKFGTQKKRKERIRFNTARIAKLEFKIAKIVAETKRIELMDK